MSVIGSEILAGASGNQGYFIQKSLRFRSSASAYLNRTPASAGNRKTFTWSVWVKRGSLGADNSIISARSDDNNRFNVKFVSSTNVIQIENVSSGSQNIVLNTVSTYRDPSAWYHIVIVSDTTNSTSANRIRLYVNNVEITSFSPSTYPSQNTDLYINGAFTHTIGRQEYSSPLAYFDGYQTEINFIDGQALTPSSFGEYSTQTGVWQAKKYSGTYGTNGFYLPFSNNSSTTTLGYDFSGNGNNWTTNNISLTSGSTYDSMVDVPTVGELASNYAVLNPLQNGGITLSNANLTGTKSTSSWLSAFSTIGVSSGKWYWEGTCTSSSGGEALIGIVKSNATINNYVGADANGWSYYTSSSSSFKINNTSTVSYGSTYTTNDVIGVALDLDAGTLTFYKNNVSQGTAYSSLSGEFFPAISCQNSSAWSVNFGQRPFAYTPPTGFKALNTYNLPTPTIGALPSSQANKYFDATTYTGTGSSQTITNSGGFQPDLVWVKSRSVGASHAIEDSVRGFPLVLNSDTTGGEQTVGTQITGVTSSGFTLGADTSVGWSNYNGRTYVGWQWRASNATAVSNTAGSITSTVSANTTSGFSVVTYTGTGVNATIGHGLGVAPKFIIIKERTSVSNWVVQHDSLGWDKGFLGITTAAATTATAFSNNTAPSSSTFTVSNYSNGDNTLTRTYIAYVWAEVPGFSKFGSYTGNGSSDGTFVYTGFRPKYVMIKRTDASGDSWFVQDSSRSSYNVVSEYLLPNSSDSAASYNSMDFLSNGFKIRATGSGYNASNGNYIYMAFAEAPTKFALAR